MSRRGRPGSHDDPDEHGLGGSDLGGPEAPQGQSRLIPEGLRRVLTQGAQALFTSEENVRERIGEMRLPKEAISFLMQQTERTRADLFGIASKEVRRMLRTFDLSGELRRTLLSLKVRVRAEITFEETTPKVRLRSRIIRRDDVGPAGADGPDAETRPQPRGAATAQAPRSAGAAASADPADDDSPAPGRRPRRS